MPSLSVHRDFQRVHRLPFCYLCGDTFARTDEVSRDHVPPKNVFNPRDRINVLTLKTHRACNARLSVDDKKVGQLIALRRRESPSAARDYALQFRLYPGVGVALENLNVDAAIWRWVRGLHTALYAAPLSGKLISIQTPFPRADKESSRIEIRPILEQHLLAVEAIKRNRMSATLDTVVGYNGKLRYECVWGQSDDEAAWFCMFALDVYGWKELGSHTAEIPTRGCVGLYILFDGTAPPDAARDRRSRVAIPNIDRLDPFAR